jgi:ABC-type transport system involved in multi-copper enzyme maturation permease subunit
MLLTWALGTAAAQIMGSTMSVVLTFPLERNLLVREQNSGMYRIWTYFIGRTTTDFAMNVFFPLLFSLIVYWFIGLSNTAGQFFMFYFTLWLACNTASSLGLALGSAFPTAEVAISLAPVVLIPFVLFGGLFASTHPTWPPSHTHAHTYRCACMRLTRAAADLNGIGAWLNWLQWLSIFKYAYQALVLNDMTDLPFVCTESQYIQVGPNRVCPITNGNQVIKALGLDGQGLWFPLLMMVVLTIFFRILGLYFLYWQTNRVLKKN